MNWLLSPWFLWGIAFPAYLTLCYFGIWAYVHKDDE